MAKSAAKPLSKMEAVRRALSDLGNDAMPKAIQPHVKEKYGVDMSVDHVSTYKSQILRKKAKRKGKKAAASAASANGAATAVAAPKAVPTTPAARKPAAGSISEQVAMLKAASAALGKEEAKRIIDLF